MRDTIDMAREANLAKYGNGLREGVTTFIDALKAFEALVRADEREACAKVCESNVWSKDVAWWQEATKSEVSVESSIHCAAAIRARGETK
jgi:hypothetical protein